MSDYSRMVVREDTYTNWNQFNQDLAPNGLRLEVGEYAVVLADSSSAALGISNASAVAGDPTTRKANNGEVLFFKIGMGPNYRWDQLPVFWPFRMINYASGRKLGSTTNGQKHQYYDPNEAFAALFKPVYTAPKGTLTIKSNNVSIAGGLLQVGQVLTSVAFTATPTLGSYRIKEGLIVDTYNQANVGLAETAASPNTIGAFNRSLSDFSITQDDDSPSAGLFRRTYELYLTDDRPSAEGGAVSQEVASVSVDAVYPEFFGKSTVSPASITDQNDRGDFLVETLSALTRRKGDYAPGAQNYTGGEYGIYGRARVLGTLSRIDDALGVNQFSPDGHFPPASVLTALVSIPGRFSNVVYDIYVSKTAYFSPIDFKFKV